MIAYSLAKQYIFHIALLLVALVAWYLRQQHSNAAENITWIRDARTPFAKLLLRLESLTHGCAFLEESYHKVLELV